MLSGCSGLAGARILGTFLCLFLLCACRWARKRLAGATPLGVTKNPNMFTKHLRIGRLPLPGVCHRQRPRPLSSIAPHLPVGDSFGRHVSNSAVCCTQQELFTPTGSWGWHCAWKHLFLVSNHEKFTLPQRLLMYACVSPELLICN